MVRPRVPKEDINTLHDQLKKIEPEYPPEVSKKEHLKDVPGLAAYLDTYAVITPYSFYIKKCINPSCCGEILTQV